MPCTIVRTSLARGAHSWRCKLAHGLGSLGGYHKDLLLPCLLRIMHPHHHQPPFKDPRARLPITPEPPSLQPTLPLPPITRTHPWYFEVSTRVRALGGQSKFRPLCLAPRGEVEGAYVALGPRPPSAALMVKISKHAPSIQQIGSEGDEVRL